MTTNKRWSELVQNTVKKVMPDGYHFNYIQCSQTTESIYFSILNENRLYYFRVSSHHRKKREDNVTTFLSGKYNGFKELSEAIGEYLKSNRFVRISDKHILILLLYLNNSFKLFWRDDTFYYIENGMDIYSGINGILKHYIKALLRYGVLYQENLSNQIKISNSGKSLLAKYKKLLSPIYKGIDMEAVNSETLFNLVVDEKFANEFFKSEKIERLNNLFPENAIKAYVDNNKSRLYNWFIPKRLRGKIKIGDQVKVINLNHTKIVTVTELYIAEKEEITKMKPVIKILDNKE
ncbi:TPA: hypothetical protein IVO84_000389 [Enterococcus faecium]|uniref:Uncharacterized protein n=2 Tax=Enterococcus faecium TaxID=1352 RepID=A0AAV3GYC7_ENTFC|nr:hypothetical protein [Enterococcus faecium]EJX55075.1 hypothetical protein HMPREF1378_00508 [Enterococcus faecium R496]EOI53089.1 hypothetical protein UKE_03018 [Enterococcus faecium EnGen0314]EOI59963.1 hypothetical protein UKG_03030 [Enterococcus faecium EnGen0316]EOI60188.1 hypothetical protein UKI_03058 [Enterococcus faecium EnGen0318]EOI67435.1 hypothetical protein UKK_03036 [Enterococcus faecium EnGen0319]